MAKQSGESDEDLRKRHISLDTWTFFLESGSQTEISMTYDLQHFIAFSVTVVHGMSVDHDNKPLDNPECYGVTDHRYDLIDMI